MGLGEIFMLAIGVSMDAFAVSMCKGVAVKKAGLRQCMTCGLWFGSFQGLMPLIGYFIAKIFADAEVIKAYDHWVAFGLLTIIGINMLKEAFEKGCDCEKHNDDMSFKTMFPMAIATSIDALAVGITLAVDKVPMKGKGNIFLAVIVIGIATGLFSGVGVKIGNIFGSRYEKKAQITGGAVLILLGIKLLVEGILETQIVL